MKNTVILFMICAFSWMLEAQSLIPITVIVPPQKEIVGESNYKQLRSKLQAALVQNGLGGEGGGNYFILFPIVTNISEEVTGGSPSMYIIHQDVEIFLANYDLSIVFANAIIQLKGVGLSSEKAAINAASNFTVKHPELQGMLANGKLKLANYLAENCSAILNEANTLEKTGEYEMALLTLQNLPSISNPCIEKVNEARQRIYSQWEYSACSEYITKARISLAANDLEKCVTYLLRIPPGDNCPDINPLIDSLSEQNRINELKDWERLKMIHEGNLLIEERKAEALKAFYEAYGKSLGQRQTEKVKDIIINKFNLF